MQISCIDGNQYVPLDSGCVAARGNLTIDARRCRKLVSLSGVLWFLIAKN